MKFYKFFLCASLFIASASFLFAQEHIVPLRCNPALVKYTKEAKMNHTFVWRLISDSLMAKLPFLDDFSHGGPYPNDSLWLDNAVFINNTYPICPPTLGVATLDGVNSEGQPYNPNCPIGASYPADSLTSRPIDLTYNYLNTSQKLDAADSVYLSFYWQAGGRGYAPLPNDTLLLQFRTGNTPWTTVWYQLGYTPVAPDTGFHLVMIMLNDTVHNLIDAGLTINPFNSDFQFRFKNYACTSGNVDQWNIDEVYLNENRSYRDTFSCDISFVYESPSMLANYEYMPWEQFTCNDLADTIFIAERNNCDAPANLTY
ncbi:MAG TPA: hypothetical protein VK808_09645, partial [Bacteroidia bacterium]|nr:hypothetical protein [Bacteroidia bacterium]